MTTSASIRATVYGTAAEPRVCVYAHIMNGTDVVSTAEFFDAHLAIFNCVGFLKIEDMIDIIRSLKPGIEITYDFVTKPEVGHVVNGVAYHVNRKLAEVA